MRFPGQGSEIPAILQPVRGVHVIPAAAAYDKSLTYHFTTLDVSPRDIAVCNPNRARREEYRTTFLDVLQWSGES
jgi:hypothetical protein